MNKSEQDASKDRRLFIDDDGNIIGEIIGDHTPSTFYLLYAYIEQGVGYVSDAMVECCTSVRAAMLKAKNNYNYDDTSCDTWDIVEVSYMQYRFVARGHLSLPGGGISWESIT